MKQRTVHEFLHPLQAEYRECLYCGERKSLVCLRCGYCYECHPAMEEMEKSLIAKAPLLVEDMTVA
jgi:hypothetical protein